MVDPTLPKRPHQVGERRFIIDKNGVGRTVYVNPYQQQDDHERYVREKGAESPQEETPAPAPAPAQAPPSGYEDYSGEEPPSNEVAPAAPSTPPSASAAPQQKAYSWLQPMLQKYAQDIPLKLSLAENAPVISPEMLAPDEARLQQMDIKTRQGLGRAFLVLASKYYGNHTLKNAFLEGTKIRGYIPNEMVSYYKWLIGGGSV